MKKLCVSIAAILMAACMLFVSLAEDAENSQLVQDAAELISSATADERQEIFKDLIWYMIFVDGADAVEEAFSVVGMFFAGDDMPASLIPEDFSATAGETQQLTAGQAVEVADSYIMEVQNSEISAQIYSFNADGIYFEAGYGKQFIVLNLSFTNLHTESLCPDEIIECELTYDGNYKYDGQVIVELNGNFAQGGEVMPLCSEKVCLFFEVPDMVADSDAPIEISLAVENNENYSYTVR